MASPVRVVSPEIVKFPVEKGAWMTPAPVPAPAMVKLLEYVPLELRPISAPEAIVTLPVPREPLLLSTRPALMRIPPVKVFVPVSVRVLAALFFVRPPEPEMMPERV